VWLGTSSTKWYFDPSSRLATTDMGRKLGAVDLCEEELAPQSNTVGKAGAYTSLASVIFIHLVVSPNRHGQKIGGLCPFLGGGSGFPCDTMSPGQRPTSIPSGILIHPAIWPQRTCVKNWGLYPSARGALQFFTPFNILATQGDPLAEVHQSPR